MRVATRWLSAVYRYVWSATVMAAALLLGSDPLMGQSKELVPGLRVNLDSPPAEGHSTGYWPVICEITNRTDNRYAIEVRSPPARSVVLARWIVSRRVSVEPQSTARITLWLPPPGIDQSFEFTVNGTRIEPPLSVSGRRSSSARVQDIPFVLTSREAAKLARRLRLGSTILILEEPKTPEKFSAFERPAVPVPKTFLPGIPLTTAPGSATYGLYVDQELQLVVWETPMAAWDTHWISYTPFQGMVLTPAEWEGAPPAVQDAIIRWVECGGMLALLDLRASSLEEKPVDHPTVFVRELFAAETKPDPSALERRQRILASFPISDALAAALAESPDKLEKLGPRPLPCGFGEVYYVLGNYAELDSPGLPKVVSPTAEKLLHQWGQGIRRRHQLATDEFLQNRDRLAEALGMLGGLGVPVLGFFLVLVVFSVVIGPVALQLLSKFNRRTWLLWLVPVVAGICCLVVFVYGFFGEGISAQVAMRSLTVLDERHHRATTLGVLGIYSPINPPGGIEWDYEIEPMFLEQLEIAQSIARHDPPRGETYRQVVMDWTEKQHLVSGWVRPRVNEFVLARRSERRRERLSLRREGSRLWAANHFGTGLRNLVLCDHDGQWWRAEYLAAGDEVELQRCEPPANYQRALQAVRSQPERYWGGYRISAGRGYDPATNLEDEETAVPNRRMFRTSPATRPTVATWPDTGPTNTRPAPSLDSPPTGPSDSPPASKPYRQDEPLVCPGVLPGWLTAGSVELRFQLIKGDKVLPGWMTLGSRGSAGSGYGQWLYTGDSLDAEELLCPGRYFAELESSIFLTSGLRWVGTRQERCYVLGILEGPTR